MKIYDWERGKKGATDREREALACFAVDGAIKKLSPHLGFATNLHGVKGNYYHPHFRNDEREADVLCG